MTERMQRLAQFCAETRFEDLPPALVEQAKRHILDTFGAALAGADSAVALQARQVFGAEPGTALVWGTTLGVGAGHAALLNGIAAHALELDDTGGCDHSGAVVLPAVMAALSLVDRPVDGREFITAVVIGYEIGRRVLEACGSYAAHNSAGWHSTATCGVFGAAAACARIFALDVGQTVSALGIAGSFSGGLWAFIHDGSQSKKLHSGRAAEGGLLAARFAREGVSGPSVLFDDVWGDFSRLSRRVARNRMHWTPGWDRSGNSRAVRSNPTPPAVAPIRRSMRSVCCWSNCRSAPIRWKTSR